METIIEIINSTDRLFTIDELKQLRSIMLEKIREIRKPPPKKRGRKFFYTTDEDRKIAHQKQKNEWAHNHLERRRKPKPEPVVGSNYGTLSP
jgi:hypothetical protein